MVTLFAAGGESTASLLGSAAWMLAQPSRHPATGARKPGAACGHSSKRRCATSRRFGATTGTCGTTPALGGVELPADSHLLLLWGAANRDPSPLRDARRVPSRPRRSQGAHQFREGSALLRRRSAGTLGGPDRLAAAARSHLGDRSGRRRTVVAEHPGAPPRASRARRHLIWPHAACRNEAGCRTDEIVGG